MFADEIRRAVEASSRITLPAVTALLWRAYGEGKVSEAEAEALSALIEARQVGCTNRGDQSSSIGRISAVPSCENAGSPGISSDEGMAISPIPSRNRRTSTGSRPRTDASMERRRRWAASGRLPPALAARFTLAEQAVLALVAAETARRGDCRLAVGHVASMVGVAETTVRNAIREARFLGLLTVEERRLTGFRNDTNVVRIISPEWTAWLRLARKEVPSRDSLSRDGVQDRHPIRPGGGCKFPNRTPTQVLEQGKLRPTEASQRRIARAGKPS